MIAQLREQIRATLQAHVTELEFQIARLTESIEGIKRQQAFWLDLLNKVEADDSGS